MSGQSIGELFVKLGFDVDDTKLKGFDSGIKEVYGNIKQLAATTAAGVGFYQMAKDAMSTATQIENLATVFGTATKAAQAWGAAVHENNPLKSYKEGLASFGTISQYLTNSAFNGTGAIALNRLGIQFNGDLVQHPEQILDKLFDNIPKLLKQHPENRSLYSQLVGEVTGDPANIGVFERGRDFADRAARNATVYEGDLSQNANAARQIAALEDTWDRFVAHIFATISPTATNVIDTMAKKGIFSMDTVRAIGSNSFLGDVVDSGRDWYNHASSDALPAIDKMFGGNQKDSIAFWAAHGYDQEHIAAFLGHEQAESSFNPRARSADGKYVGIAQWNPDRQASILKGTGIDVNKANHWQQLQAIAWEMKSMGLDDDFRASKDPSRFLSKKYEIHEKFNKQHGDETAYREGLTDKQLPVVTVALTQHITSNADAAEVARISNEGMREAFTAAYLDQHGENP